MSEPETSASPRGAEFEGRVYCKSRGYYFVRSGDKEFLCRISNRLRKELVFPNNPSGTARKGVTEVRAIDLLDPVAVGDLVRFADGGGGTGSIKEVLPRKNKFSRMTHRGKPLEQILAANVDQVVGVFAAALPDLRLDLLDRVCVQAEILEAPLMIAITKMDLADDEEIDELKTLYGGLGYTIMTTSVIDGTGIDELRARLGDKQSVFVGESGVGKSSLLNAIQPGLGLRVGEIRNSKRGRGSHTTTMVQASALDSGGWIIDTPGINDLGLFVVGDEERDPAWYFRELRPLIEHCRFGEGCRHEQEPGCKVLEALEAESIDQGRYESFLSLRGELSSKKGGRRE